MLNTVMACIVAIIGMSCMVAGGLVIAAFVLGYAADYAWSRAKDAHNMALLSHELNRLRKAGKLWGYKGDDAK